MKPTPKHPPPTEPSAPHDAGQVLPLPHERDASAGHIAEEPDPKMKQAKQDLDAGQVDTDMWGTAGLDNSRKEQLVPLTKPKP